MSEKLIKAVSIFFKLVLYLAFVVLTIVGASKTSLFNLGLELIGLIGVICMLWWYNLRNK